MNTKFMLAFASFVMLFLTSCRSDDSSGESTVNYTINVQYPTSYNSSKVNGAKVVLKNLTTNVEIEKTTVNGVIDFTNLPKGSYTVTASKTLTASEAESLTGVANETYLNATVAQLNITLDGSTTLTLEGGKVGDWVIKEFYYSGAPNSYYFYDGFVEIYNNSTETLYADGLLFGNTKAASSSTTGFYGYITQGLTDVYLGFVFQIPGSGTEHPVEPGKSIVIAIDAINHKTDPNGNANSPVNLGAGVSDFEVYYSVNPNTTDTDNPNVPNVNILYAYSTSLFDYLPGVFGSGLVIFRHDNPSALERSTEPNTTNSTQYVKVPKEYIIDGLDAVANSSVAVERKRLPVNIDAGMNTVGGTYTGTSLRRKVKQVINGRKVLMDTNNSSTDFEATSTPTPKTW